MFELRILTGLQAGARLKLSPGCHRIGYDDDCDIVVRGYGVDAFALQLVIEHQHIVAIPMQLHCGTRLSDSRSAPFNLAPGQAFHIGEVWLTVETMDTPWPLPQQWRQAAEMLENVELERAADATPAAAQCAPSVFRATPVSRRLHQMGKWLATSCTTMMVCGCTLAYALKHPTIDNAQPLEESSPTVDNVVEPAPALAMARALPATPDAAHNNPAERQHRVNESATDIPPPAVDADHAATSPAPVRQLPFAIKQIVSGPMPYVVTDDNVRIFEGGAYQGYRLAAVKGYKLVFQGNRQVEIDW